jgi:5-methylcytosine-specific restriction endonuclease McrA
VNSKLARPVLVLNKFYMALDVVTARRAIVLLYIDHAEVIEISGGRYETFGFGGWLEKSTRASADNAIHTVSLSIEVPMVVRLKECGRLPQRKVALTRKNVLMRDNHRCQYCGRRLPPSQLSLDHVIPLSRGGRESWTNIVCACFECNSRKGGRNPSEVGMKLRNAPRTPDFNQAIRSKLPPDRPDIWNRFLS